MAKFKKEKETLEQTVKNRTIELEEEKERAEAQKERAERSEQFKQQFLAKEFRRHGLKNSTFIFTLFSQSHLKEQALQTMELKHLFHLM